MQLHGARASLSVVFLLFSKRCSSDFEPPFAYLFDYLYDVVDNNPIALFHFTNVKFK